MKSACQALEQHQFIVDEASTELDSAILALCRDQADASEPLLCLRCRVSHPIAGKLKKLLQKHREQYELDLRDMAACVLDDSGELFLRLQARQADGTLKKQRKGFSWNTLQEFPEQEIKPFGAEVIRSFDPERSMLSTWAHNKVQSNADLKAYLRSCGLLLISDWALLADSTPTRVRNAWSRCGRGSLQLEQVETLHHSYVNSYWPAKELYRSTTNKNSGWTPDREFLAALHPAQSNDEGLKEIAQAIRFYLAGTSLSRGFVAGEEASVVDQSSLVSPQISDNENASKDLNQLIAQALERSGPQRVKSAVDEDRCRWGKDPSRQLAWQLFAQGLGQREIAERCDHKQAWVSKLLKEKQLSESIAQAAAVELVRHSAFETVRMDPDGADRMVEALRNHLIYPEREGDIALLRKWTQNALKP
ncbi:hypothetical protein [Prochlorococcus marinus]|nr:hypothetical protein [Prochlorococcus marinus]KZR67271.1 hypothetical protein PMIT1312_00562 [Prochlorococcus marinus str. MIT 1312]